MVESPPTADAAEQPVESFVQSRAYEEVMTNTINTMRDQLGEHMQLAMIHGKSSISLERLSCWAGILSRHIEQQPEQGSEGRDRSDESDVQSAATLQLAIEALDEEIRYNCRMADIFRREIPYTAAAYREREKLFHWIKSKMIESVVGESLQREVTKTNT